MRSGELCSLTISDIDFAKRQIVLRPENTKAGYMRVIPISTSVAEFLKGLAWEAERLGKKHLFLNSDGTRQTSDNLIRRFRTLLKKLDLENKDEVNIHTLRKTYISHLIMAGEDPVKVMAIVGHRDWSTIRRYLALSPKYLSQIESLPY
jgi:integrase